MSNRQKKGHLEKMLRLGISESEARIYTTLLEKRELSVLEIHELTNIPRIKVYEITRKLILRGMCIKKQLRRKTRYQAVEPRRALDRLVKKYENDLDKKKKLAKEFIKMVYPIYNRETQSVGVSENVEIIDDLPSIHERYISLVKNTKQELVGFMKRPYTHQHKRQKVGEQENEKFEILTRGVIVRMIYEFPRKDEIEFLIPHIEKCIKVREKARLTEYLPMKMYIFDRRYVLMALTTSRRATSTLTMLVIEHPGFALAAKILFNHLWEKGKDYRVLKSLIRKKARTEL